jgi:kynurenine formamidase
VFPGDPPVATAPALTHAEHGVAVAHLRMGSQSGTHVDAPRHVLPGGQTVDALSPSLLVTPALVADLRGRPPRSLIGEEALAPWLPALGPGIALVLHTGWAAAYGTDDYWTHPALHPAAAAAVLARGVRTLAVDAPSVDPTVLAPGQADASRLPVHHLVAGAGGVVVENLTGLERVDFADPLLSVLPLRLTGADGAPCRAVALKVLP